jgi:hypothetical protein
MSLSALPVPSVNLHSILEIEALGMQAAQTLLTVVFGALGVLMILLARYEKANYDIRKILIISWMSKYTIGLLLIIIAILIFLSQFITRK